jgi:hypothetical protein
MRKILAFSILFMLTFTLIVPDIFGQTRRYRESRNNTRGLATNAAIVGGGAAIGAMIGGRRGAAIGAGSGLLYATSRNGTVRRHPNSNTRRALKVAGGTLVGAGVGSFAGKRGAAVGALAGAGVTYLYTRNGRRIYRSSNGRHFYVQNNRRVYLR